MGWIKYKYDCKLVHNSPPRCVCLWPNIEVELSLKDKKIKVLALIDSGCTTTNVNAEIAQQLGIDITKCQKIPNTGIGGVKEGYLSELAIKVKDFGEEFRSKVILMEGLPYSVLLGQDNFFENFDIKFEKRNNTFELRRV
jgi:hypothetical protein